MPTVILVGDLGTGHGNYGSTKVLTGSSTVFVEGRAIARKGDLLEPHHDHRRIITGGSNSVFVDGKPAARVGDNINCGGVLIGTSSVNIG
ncbi:PAAR domain-containing protein [Proteus sp. CD3]|uniref:PAAR domain-containing protein n=1 Tax=Proteus sp. CD3 TaxID=1921565 RepID=UPI00124ACCEB|nr:PAAR domain-containing protein [Proteus sp. CD3]QEZ91104.1 hypothetical protein BTA34_01540 [Proteus sp. CD3]